VWFCIWYTLALTLAVRQLRRLTDGPFDDNGGRLVVHRLVACCRELQPQPQAVSGRG